MVKNNKGVTLVELLIVIVVMGIIAAFSIPAVGTIITNTQKDAILADALSVENGAKLYCAQTTCDASQTLDWDDIKDYVEGLDTDYYDFDDTGTNDLTIATKTDDGWSVTLEADGSHVAADKVWEWPAGIPSALDRSHVAADTN